MARKAEGGSGGSSGGFCMIDPVILGGVINDLATMEAAITAEMKGLKTEFEKVGVSTGAVNDLVKVSHWLHGELPMLRRRHTAALLLSSQGMEFSPGTKMLSMPEDPDLATKQAADLAVNRVRDGLDGKPPGRDGITDAASAIQRIRDTKGQLSPVDLLFLETFYRGLGKDVYKIPYYLKNDDNWVAPTRTTYMPGEILPTAIDPKARTELAAAIVGGLLTLSDERRGGGWNRLPKFVQEAASDPWRYPMSTNEMGGTKAQELASFLAHANNVDRAGVVFSKRLAITVAESVEALRTVNPRTNDEVGKTFLALAGRNEQAMHDLLTNEGMNSPAGADDDIYAGYNGSTDFLAPLTTYAWSDDGKAVASMLDWIADTKRSSDPQRQTLGLEAMQGLVTTLADTSVMNRNLDTEWSGREAVGVVNPEIARSLARDASAYLKEFSDPGAPLFTSEAKGMSSGEEVSARFFTLVATDSTAAEALAGAIYRHNVDGVHDALAHPDHVIDQSGRAGQLQGLLDSALHNVAIERTDDKEQAKADADAIRGKALGIANQFLGKAEIPSIPGVDPVDIADKILGRLNNMDTDPVDPQQIKTEGVDTRASGASRLLVRYDITKALVESGQLKVEDLPESIRTDDDPPRLRSPADFRSDRYNDLADAYRTGTAKVPAAAKLENDYLNEFSSRTSEATSKYLAEDKNELKTKLRIG